MTTDSRPVDLDRLAFVMWRTQSGAQDSDVPWLVRWDALAPETQEKWRAQAREAVGRVVRPSPAAALAMARWHERHAVNFIHGDDWHEFHVSCALRLREIAKGQC